jgi:hypothetical protein
MAAPLKGQGKADIRKPISAMGPTVQPNRRNPQHIRRISFMSNPSQDEHPADAGAREAQPGTNRMNAKDKEDTDEQTGIGETRKGALNESEDSSGEDESVLEAERLKK